MDGIDEGMIEGVGHVPGMNVLYPWNDLERSRRRSLSSIVDDEYHRINQSNHSATIMIAFICERLDVALCMDADTQLVMNDLLQW